VRVAGRFKLTLDLEQILVDDPKLLSMLLENLCWNYAGLSERMCPCGSGRMYCYRDSKWREWICWSCGNYDSDTPAFRQSPELYRDIVRKNGTYFLNKYARYARTH
jgi:hypothetical protein